MVFTLVDKMSQKKEILVIDDDQLILTSIGMVLEIEGYCVGLAENGRDAVEKAKRIFMILP